MNRDTDPEIPDGQEWMRALQVQILDPCCASTEAYVGNDSDLSTKLACFGSVLSLTDQLSSCHWGCEEHDHLVHYLVGRGVGHASAAWILVRHGHYDAALSLIRGIGEIANLLALFSADGAALQGWKDREHEYGPVKVRLALERLGVPVPISQHVYKALSERAAHVTPKTRPEVYSPTDRPLASGTFQKDGVQLSMNCLAFVFGQLAFAATRVVPAPPRCSSTIVSAAKILVSWGVDERETSGPGGSADASPPGC